MRFASALLLFAACGGSQPADLHVGGSIRLDQCGYSVKTVDGASRPQMSQATLGADPTPRFIHVDIAGDPTHQLAFLWRTNDETTLATTVQWGVSGALDHSTDGFTFVYDLSSGGTARMHETHLCDLVPDTEYSYRVGGKGIWSPTYTVRTAPDRTASPDAQLTIAILGDSRGNYATWGMALQQAFQTAQPDLVMFSGDMVTLGPIQDDWDQWFGQSEAELHTAPLVVAHGNHEVNGVNFFSQFAMPGDEQNFNFDFGPLHLAVGNDTPPDTETLADTAQLLDGNLAPGDGAPWSAVMNHKTIWSAAVSDHPMDTTTTRAAFQPVIDSHQVDLAFEGHDHNYERTLPMKGTVAGAGTTYVRMGTAGAPLDASGTDYWTAATESTYGFGIARVRAGQFAFTAYRLDGSTIDTFTLTK